MSTPPLSLKGYRTIILSVASLIIFAGGQLTGIVTDGQTLAIIGSVVAIATMVLRYFTDGPIGQK